MSGAVSEDDTARGENKDLGLALIETASELQRIGGQLQAVGMMLCEVLSHHNRDVEPGKGEDADAV